MVITYLQSHGGTARLQGKTWDLIWPDGATTKHVVFSAREAEHAPSARHLTLEDQRIRSLTTQLPHVVERQPIPRIILTGLPSGVDGTWSLWHISLLAADCHKQ